jgi:hypothetical protein
MRSLSRPNLLSFRPFFATLVAFVLFALALFQPMIARAHIENGVFTEDFRISEIKVRSKGPYKPGDVIVFEVISNLPKTQIDWIQITADCLAYPAEWHRDTEKNFADGSFVKKYYAIGIISSGCYSGERQVYEVILSDVKSRYTRVSVENATLPSFIVQGGHLSETGDANNLMADSLKKMSIPSQVRLEKKSSQTRGAVLPRTTSGGQTLDWVVSGNCRLKRIFGASDLGGELWVGPKGTCVVSANTPWGSNLYQPLNQAHTIEILPASAIRCQKLGSKEVKYFLSKNCPKGFKKTT